MQKNKTRWKGMNIPVLSVNQYLSAGHGHIQKKKKIETNETGIKKNLGIGYLVS